MNFSNNFTWTDGFTLVLILVTVGFYIYNILRDNRKANDLLQAKNYYFLSLMLQIHKKKLSASFSEFASLLGEEGQESFFLKLYPVVESKSIKNIAVDDLLKYYSEPVKHQGDVDFKDIQKSWFYCFDYCEYWEISQENAIQEQKDIVERETVSYNEFYEKYKELHTELKEFPESSIAPELFNSFVNILVENQIIIESNQKLTSMYSVVQRFYKPIWDILTSSQFAKEQIIMRMIHEGQKIYGIYWAFISGKITDFSSEIENQRKAELEFKKSIMNLVNYSIQHSNGKFKDMYRTLGNQMDGKR